MSKLSRGAAASLVVFLSTTRVMGFDLPGVPGTVQVSVASNGEITVQFTLPEKLAFPPWEADALANYGFSLEKHGPLPYFPVRPVAFEVHSGKVSVELLKSKVSRVSNVLSQARMSPQPSIESDVVVGLASGRPVPLCVFPTSEFPTQHVVLDDPVSFGEKRIARVKIYPFARDADGGGFTRADRLVFRIMPGRYDLTRKTSPSTVKDPTAPLQEPFRPLILGVASGGVYRVGAEDLALWWGEDAASLTDMRLTCRGEDVAYHVVGDGDDLFENGESILFYGIGGDQIFSAENAYWLSRSGGATSMQGVSGSPPGEGLLSHLPRCLRFQENHVMYEGLRPGTREDYWFWAKVTSPGELVVDFALRNPSDSPDFQAELKVGLHGATASHTTRVSLNGNLLIEEEWGGYEAKTLTATFAQSLFHEGANTVRIEEVGGGESPDVIYLDFVELRYDSELVTVDGRLDVNVPVNTVGILVKGFPNDEILVFDVTEERTPRHIVDFATREVDGSWQVELRTLSDLDAKYAILSAESALHPGSIRQRSESTWSEEANASDWIVIAPPEFLESAQVLASYRASQGWRTTVVDVQDVYDEFNYGITSPEALREFARFAYRNWERPAPQYLLLLGDGHVDYVDWWNTHQPNYILPHYSWIPPLGWAPDDEWFGCVDGDDALPEVHVGRLPARSADEAAALVSKIIDYEATPIAEEWQKRVTFCASAGDLFQDICQAIAGAGPPNLEAQFLFRDDFPNAESLKQRIIQSLDEGTWLFFYVGHGSVDLWSGSILHVSDVPSLTNADKLPIMCMLTCLSGYFSVPWKECLAEELTRASNGGAVGCIAPTGLGYPSEHLVLGQEIIRHLLSGAALGECLGEAKAASYARGLPESFLRGFGLIGDPATVPGCVPATPSLLWFH